MSHGYGKPSAALAKPISDLPNQHRYVTGHDKDGKAVVIASNDFTWQSLDNNQLGFSVPFTTAQFPADLNGEVDVKAHDERMASGTLGLVNPGGTVFRFVDWAPGYRCGMHRTQSLDYGIVLHGEIDMILDSGEVHHLRPGDVAIQRATQHQWQNTSDTEWARMIFILQDCKPLVVGGEALKEDISTLKELPPSGN